MGRSKQTARMSTGAKQPRPAIIERPALSEEDAWNKAPFSAPTSLAASRAAAVRLGLVGHNKKKQNDQRKPIPVSDSDETDGEEDALLKAATASIAANMDATIRANADAAMETTQSVPPTPAAVASESAASAPDSSSSSSSTSTSTDHPGEVKTPRKDRKNNKRSADREADADSDPDSDADSDADAVKGKAKAKDKDANKDGVVIPGRDSFLADAESDVSSGPDMSANDGSETEQESEAAAADAWSDAPKASYDYCSSRAKRTGLREAKRLRPTFSYRKDFESVGRAAQEAVENGRIPDALPFKNKLVQLVVTVDNRSKENPWDYIDTDVINFDGNALTVAESQMLFEISAHAYYIMTEKRRHDAKLQELIKNKGLSHGYFALNAAHTQCVQISAILQREGSRSAAAQEAVANDKVPAALPVKNKLRELMGMVDAIIQRDRASAATR